MLKDVERGEVGQGLAVGINRFEVLQKQPQFLVIELDGRLCAPLDAVVPEIVFEDFG